MSPLAAGTLVATLGVAALAAHGLVNARLGLRRPPADPPAVDQAVAVLIPARDEARRIGACLRAVLAQRGVARLEVVVLDDESTDGTATVVRAVSGGDPRVRLVTGAPLPAGWAGKTHACHQLAQAAPAAEVLVFLDADVVLEPHAVAGYVALLGDADLLCALVRQQAGSWSERLIQPLLHGWWWLTILPLWAMQGTRRPGLAVAAGHVLTFRRAGYDDCGGFAAVPGSVLEDRDVARAVTRAGGRLAFANGAMLARCRMYTSWPELADGYGKSICGSFSTPIQAAALATMVAFLYLLPPLAAASGATIGLVGYLLAVASRAVSAVAFRDRIWPDAFLHPLSIALAGWLVARAYWRRRRGRLAWKGRPVHVGSTR